MCRKVHNEMRWMTSPSTIEGIQNNKDFMIQMYDSALRIAQVCAEDVLKYIQTSRDDLFNTYCSTSVPTTKKAYEELQRMWEEKSEEKALIEEFSSLTNQTGFKSAQDLFV